VRAGDLGRCARRCIAQFSLLNNSKAPIKIHKSVSLVMDSSWGHGDGVSIPPCAECP
jgi:hypothetical protein